LTPTPSTHFSGDPANSAWSFSTVSRLAVEDHAAALEQCA
jgi:hypothetical protein